MIDLLGGLAIHRRMRKQREILVKTILIALIAFTLSISGGAAHAAKLRCDYDRSKDKDKGFDRAKNEKGKTRKGFYIDKFTDEVVVETKWDEIGGGDTHGSISTRTRGDDSFLQLSIVNRWSKFTFPTEEEGQSNFSILSGDEMLVGMADGSVLTLYATEGSEAETSYETPKPRSGEPFWITSSATAEYLLDDQSLAALTATEARALRIVTDSRKLDLRIEGRDHDWVIQNAVRCIAEGAN